MGLQLVTSFMSLFLGLAFTCMRRCCFTWVYVQLFNSSFHSFRFVCLCGLAYLSRHQLLIKKRRLFVIQNLRYFLTRREAYSCINGVGTYHFVGTIGFHSIFIGIDCCLPPSIRSKQDLIEKLPLGLIHFELTVYRNLWTSSNSQS